MWEGLPEEAKEGEKRGSWVFFAPSRLRARRFGMGVRAKARGREAMGRPRAFARAFLSSVLLEDEAVVDALCLVMFQGR